MLMLCFSVEKQSCCVAAIFLSERASSALHWQNDIGMAAQNKQQQKERNVKNQLQLKLLKPEQWEDSNKCRGHGPLN
jgi:hypothetical protein